MVKSLMGMPVPIHSQIFRLVLKNQKLTLETTLVLYVVSYGQYNGSASLSTPQKNKSMVSNVIGVFLHPVFPSNKLADSTKGIKNGSPEPPESEPSFSC